ncbi:GNAT family N-acetyltransferase [Nocardia sp. NBC_00565]|uniref:GNAT family N-acetyltransferase n=1 Tax=Nocardia sp. NBC_00565 TaxID=2975993 RepID=UPI002E8216E9|nr:GNAT family N-acetyltransferase [Nocardia sp. NBC_00565]WUC02627.1 GNAT family N-acetyltransferase [Nocardia sp. NBC_00565]
MEDHPLSDGTVWLSRPTEADIDAIVECCQEPTIGEWVTIPVPYHREHAEAFLTEMVAPGWAADSPIWAVRRSADGPVVGMIGLGQRDASTREIGFWLVPAHRGCGLMSRAIALVCEFGFHPDGLALARISWRAFVGNHRSAAAVRRNGFHYEGMTRLGSLQRGVRRDTWLAGRLATDPSGPATDWPPGI